MFEPLNDRLDVGMCTGSGFVARRTALGEIGGWPLLDAGEDVMCSALLINAGWKSAFIRGRVQTGLAPDSLRAHIKQRMRWVRVSSFLRGYLSVSKRLGIPDTFCRQTVLSNCTDNLGFTFPSQKSAITLFGRRERLASYRHLEITHP